MWCPRASPSRPRRCRQEGSRPRRSLHRSPPRLRRPRPGSAGYCHRYCHRGRRRYCHRPPPPARATASAAGSAATTGSAPPTPPPPAPPPPPPLLPPPPPHSSAANRPWAGVFHHFAELPALGVAPPLAEPPVAEVPPVLGMPPVPWRCPTVCRTARGRRCSAVRRTARARRAPVAICPPSRSLRPCPAPARLRTSTGTPRLPRSSARSRVCGKSRRPTYTKPPPRRRDRTSRRCQRFHVAPLVGLPRRGPLCSISLPKRALTRRPHARRDRPSSAFIALLQIGTFRVFRACERHCPSSNSELAGPAAHAWRDVYAHGIQAQGVGHGQDRAPAAKGIDHVCVVVSAMTKSAGIQAGIHAHRLGAGLKTPSGSTSTRTCFWPRVPAGKAQHVCIGGAAQSWPCRAACDRRSCETADSCRRARRRG